MKETFYFSHDYNARNDWKLVKLMMKKGLEWVWAFWCIVEMLYEEWGYIMQSECERIAFELRTDEECIAWIIKESWLFQSDSEKFWSNSVNERLEMRAKKSNKASISAKTRWENREENANAMRTHKKRNAIKERKGKENKLNIVPKGTELSLSPITQDINNLIIELKNTCDELWIAYDKSLERYFAKHILNAKEFVWFCEKIEMLPVEFAKNILRASVKIKYWKWPCSWPMMIYQNYAEVYNQTKEKKSPEKNNIIYTNEI